MGDRHRAIRGISAAFHANFSLEQRLNRLSLFLVLDEERYDERHARTDEPEGGRALQREVDRAETGAAR